MNGVKRVLVTGASGFIGGNVVLELARRNYEVRAQYRREQPTEKLELARTLGAELVRADLTDESNLAHLLEGVDVVVHAAARVKLFGPVKQFAYINIDATKNLLQKASAAGCGKFLYLSTMSVHGFGQHLESDESGPYYPLISTYQKTKKAAENMVMAYRDPTMECTSIRLGFVFGPGDTTTLKPVFDMLVAGHLPLIGGFDVYNCPIYIDDAVDVITRAMESDAVGGELLNVSSGEKILLRDAIYKSAEYFGKPKPRFNISALLAMVAAAIMEFVYKRLYIKGMPPLTRYLVAQVRHDFHFSSEKIQRLLGYKMSEHWHESLKKAIDSYKECYLDCTR